MASQGQIEATAWRAGLPLARAQRLAARTGSTSAGGPRAFLALGILSAGAIFAYGAMRPVGPAAVPAVFVAAADAAGSAAGAAASAAGERAAPAAALAPVEVAAPAAMPACISTIEAQLDVLRAAAAGTGWSSQQQNVSKLVQDTLDCSDAKLQIDGSLELIGSGLADLRVRWDRADWTLNLAMIELSAAPAATDGGVADGQAIEFVIR